MNKIKKAVNFKQVLLNKDNKTCKSTWNRKNFSLYIGIHLNR